MFYMTNGASLVINGHEEQLFASFGTAERAEGCRYRWYVTTYLGKLVVEGCSSPQAAIEAAVALLKEQAK